MDKTQEVGTATGASATRSAFRLSDSIKVWLGLVVFLVLVKLGLTAFYPNAFADPSQAAVFGWVPLALFSLFGLVGVGLSERTGFPSAWRKGISYLRWIVLPLVIGAGMATLAVIHDTLTHFTRIVDASHGVTQQYTGFVPMLLVFTGGAVLVEVLYRLFTIPLLLGLISNLLLKGRWQTPIFWILAVILSAWEPLSQDVGRLTGLDLVLQFGLAYALNLTQAAFFRKYGFLAAILVRVGYYLVWHAIYIH